MRKILLFISLLVVSSAMADERGEARLERISRHYSALGGYGISFVLRVGGAEQKGEVLVAGNNSYMSIAGTEVYVKDSVRYEVRSAAKEVVVDRADAYEKELINPLSGFSSVKSEYNIEECEEGGVVAVRLTPKRSGDTIYIITGVDGESISRVRYGVGESAAELQVVKTVRTPKSVPEFDKERYKGFELIDFR